MTTLQLPGSKWIDIQTLVYIATQNTFLSLALEFQNDLSNESNKHVIIDHRKPKNVKFKKS